MEPRATTALTTTLTPALAQEIAGETSAIIGLNVIITDAAGIVLGSGDQSRVGSFHEASLSVVEHRREESHDARQAAALRGVRPGTTLPIVHQNAVVGTVGITGTPDQVLRFGQVVKRQTEILLEEAVLVRTRMTRERVLESLLRDLLAYDPNDPADVTARARDLGFDLDLPRRALVFDIDSPAAGATTVTSALRLLREAFHDLQDISCSLSPSRHVVLKRQSRSGGSPDAEAMTRLTRQIGESVGGRCVVGIGGTAVDEREIAQSYAEALTALRIGRTLNTGSPYDIDDLRTHQMVLAIPERTRQRVVADTLGSLREGKDWESVRDTVVAWVESGFVLVTAAETIGIHRNTLVHRLGRIAARAGIEDGDRRPWLALYLACIGDGLDEPANRRPSR
jgi:carbohydrate diacid regulator